MPRRGSQSVDPHERVEVLLRLEVDGLHVLARGVPGLLVGHDLQWQAGGHCQHLLLRRPLQIVEIIESKGDRRPPIDMPW